MQDDIGGEQPAFMSELQPATVMNPVCCPGGGLRFGLGHKEMTLVDICQGPLHKEAMLS